MKEINIIQNKVLSILSIFIKICDAHNLTYYTLGGTLLGAVRHQGFIPWDDDIDIGMPREDYEKLKKIIHNELPLPYVFLSEDTPGYSKAFSVIRDTSTKIIMNYSNSELEESLWIDIFPIDGMPENRIKRWIHEKNYLYRRMMVQLSKFHSIVNQNKSNRPLFETIIIQLANILPVESIISFEKAQSNYLKTIKKYSFKEKFAGNLTGAYKLREIVPSDYFGTPVELPFEGLQLKCPQYYKEYLKAIYGDNYMELPPVEQRNSHQYKIVTLGE